MDRDMLKVLLENLVDDLNKVSTGVFSIEGPFIRTTKGVTKAKVIFYISTASFIKDGKEKEKLMELDYDINLKTMTDEEIFVTLAVSILQAREKIKDVITDMLKKLGLGELLNESGGEGAYCPQPLPKHKDYVV